MTRMSQADVAAAETYTAKVPHPAPEAVKWIKKLIEEVRASAAEINAVLIELDETRLHLTEARREAAVTAGLPNTAPWADILGAVRQLRTTLATRDGELAQAEEIAVELNRNMHAAHAERDAANGKLAEEVKVRTRLDGKLNQASDEVAELQEQLTTRVGARNTRIGELDGALRKVGVDPATVGEDTELKLLPGWSTAETGWPLSGPKAPQQQYVPAYQVQSPPPPVPWLAPALHIDPEVGVMNAVYAALSPLDQEAQNAVLSWVGRRLERDQQTNR